MRASRTIYFLLIFPLVAWISAGKLSAQNVTLKLNLFNDLYAPIQDASIVINNRTAGVSDKEGKFSYELKSGQEYKIKIRHVTYRDTSFTVFADPANPVIEFKFVMGLGALEFDETQVIGEQDRDLPIQTYDPKNLILTVGPGDGITNLLKSGTLGLSTNNELSSGYSIRGGNFDENIIYVNDIEVYRPFLARSGQQEGLSFINSDMVSSIKFSSGGFESRYGDKMSSVLDIQYRRPLKFRATVSASLLGAALHIEDNVEKLRMKYNLGIRYRSNNYLLSSLDTKGEYKPNFLDFQGLVGFDLSDEWEINFFGSYSDNNYIMIPQTRSTVFGHVQEAKQLTIFFDGQERTRFRVGTGAMTLLFRPTEKQTHKLILSAFNTRETEKFDVLGQYFLGEIESDLGSDNFGEVVNTVGVGGFLNHARNELNATVYSTETKSKIYTPFYNRILQGVTHQFGIRYTHETIDDKLNEWNLLDSSGYMLPYAGPWDTSSIEVKDFRKVKNSLSSNRVQGYYQASIAWERDSQFVNVTLGVRANYWDLNNDLLVSPRVQLSWQPKFKPGKKSGIAPDILFRLSGGIYYQAPFYREMRDFNGNLNTDIKAQRSYHAVLGMDYNFPIWGRGFKFVTEVYYKYIENLIPYELDNVRIRYYGTNNSRGYATGIDMKLIGQFIEGLDSWFTMSVMKTEEDLLDDSYVDENGNTVYPGFIPRPTDQRFTFGMFFQDHIPKVEWIRVHLNMLFGSKLPFGPPNQVKYTDTLRAPFYRRVDIGFSFVFIREGQQFKKPNKFKKAFRSLWASFEVFNLFDIDNTVSYFWVRDITSRQYAVPNYLTGRLINVKLVAQF